MAPVEDSGELRLDIRELNTKNQTARINQAMPLALKQKTPKNRKKKSGRDRKGVC